MAVQLLYIVHYIHTLNHLSLKLRNNVHESARTVICIAALLAPSSILVPCLLAQCVLSIVVYVCIQLGSKQSSSLYTYNNYDCMPGWADTT